MLKNIDKNIEVNSVRLNPDAKEKKMEEKIPDNLAGFNLKHSIYFWILYTLGS